MLFCLSYIKSLLSLVISILNDRCKLYKSKSVNIKNKSLHTIIYFPIISQVFSAMITNMYSSYFHLSVVVDTCEDFGVPMQLLTKKDNVRLNMMIETLKN